jgi:hypothetical protein
MAKLFSKTIHKESRKTGMGFSNSFPEFLLSLFINQIPDASFESPDGTNGVPDATNQTSDATNEASDGTNDAWDGVNQASVMA